MFQKSVEFLQVSSLDSHDAAVSVAWQQKIGWILDALADLIPPFGGFDCFRHWLHFGS